MAGCMSRTHAGRHQSSQMSGCMTRAHARRHSSKHMLISMLRLHARRHLVLGRSTSCFYMSGCMYSFHARRHLELLGTLSCLDGSYHVLAIYVETPRASWSVYAIFDPSGKFLTVINPKYFFAPVLML
ncbi:hypothetical protein F2Q68_00019928 [Brassica cretica]|uniref:Uncharacterized protein n=1 Tax=Brassica cretica TaxID=69181 RepID=A0A8S9FR85_BRACR|nr:hypothetical protein F2Q68_00019928 [Brassica cretica]